MDELEEVLRGNENVEEAILSGELREAINRFLEAQEQTDRVLFIKRFWFCETISEIAEEFGQSTNYVNVRLHRVKEKLRKFLKAEELIG